MNVKRVNEIIGCIIFGFAVTKTAYVLFVLTRVSFNLMKLLSNGNLNGNYFPILSTIISYAEMIVFVLSVIMAIINIKKQPELIKWYLLCIGAFALAIFTPPIIFIFFVIPQCVMYLNAGVKIRNGAIGVIKNYKKIKQDIKNTEWFYGKEDDQK